MDEMKSKNISYLSFNIGEEVFAAHVSKVQNILEMLEITKIPRSPDYMLGVINLRGQVLPLVDSRIKLGMEATEYTTNTCIVVCEISINNEKVMLGVLVDSVSEVLEIENEAILPPPSIGNKFRSEFIIGVYNSNDSFIMLLDLEEIFSSDELLYLKEVEPNAPKETNSDEK